MLLLSWLAFGLVTELFLKSYQLVRVDLLSGMLRLRWQSSGQLVLETLVLGNLVHLFLFGLDSGLWEVYLRELIVIV